MACLVAWTHLWSDSTAERARVRTFRCMRARGKFATDGFKKKRRVVCLAEILRSLLSGRFLDGGLVRKNAINGSKKTSRSVLGNEIRKNGPHLELIR